MCMLFILLNLAKCYHLFAALIDFPDTYGELYYSRLSPISRLGRERWSKLLRDKVVHNWTVVRERIVS